MGVSFKRHRFPADVIRHAVWLYFRFTLSLRDVEEMLAERGIEVSYETIRCWTKKFGPQFARRLKKLRAAPSPRWHLDEMVCTVGGRRMGAVSLTLTFLRQGPGDRGGGCVETDIL